MATTRALLIGVILILSPIAAHALSKGYCQTYAAGPSRRRRNTKGFNAPGA